MKIQTGALPIKPQEKTPADRDQALREAAQMYENHFLNEMVKAMRSTVNHEDGFMKQNFAEKIFSEQLDQQYVDGWSKKGGVGLADMIYTQIKEKYYGDKQKHIPNQNHMLPLSPKREGHGISTESIQMKAIPVNEKNKLSYRFEVQNPNQGAFDVQAPMPGKIAGVERLEQGWNLVRLDHGQGLQSEMTFPGSLADSVTGMSLEPGQRLGVLDPARPVLAWNLEWI